ncbi:MAG TPA: bifunctional UDP-N-acetylglucosamine diphosphorylase/glucosamine-1-phosphate N-acetyltransferase GlmU [Acidobacteriaceae bacterium]|nr:bifunctional UDP-N-acetylglucosamine diphosphorylase/glucosamine-1-phosphate N-acetyltransferase GlmU [Terriglobia bacterium]HVC91551.1 bifunctional UDP-N-acetylglucosamine diphosphorylase/glucosamine-1-phosphate N-acetyltransferase GlmU [Acidobacteriaceae bacterium]
MEPNLFATAILAAGKGTRLKSKRAKVLHSIAGKPLLQHVLDAVLQVTRPDQVFVVVGHQAEEVERAVAATGVHFVAQTQQLGTGHAVQCLREFVRGATDLLVLSGDVPLIRPETIERLRAFHQAQQAAMTILTARPENPFGYGRILRASPTSPEVAAIVEQKALAADQQHIGEINSGIYVFRVNTLYRYIDSLQANNAHGEYYLTDVAAILRTADERVVALETTDATEVLGANTIAEMMELDAALRMQTARRLMAQGVTIQRPETCVIDADVTVGPDTILEPFVQLLGNTCVGEDCHIRSYSVIQNSTVGNKVLVRNSCILDDATVGDGASIGPFAHLRPASEIGAGAHIGNFVETKKARLGIGSKANHLTYLGDVEIGSGCNIGAGVITCNYDGVHKHPTQIGDRVFVGSNATLVAPVSLADDSYVAAASCITEPVPAGALALGRARQTVKPGWVKQRRAAQQKKKSS